MRKKLIIFTISVFAMCGAVSAQSPRAVLYKAKMIKLLQSSREDVKKVLKGFKLKETDSENYAQVFSNAVANVEITYSSGNCSREEKDKGLATWKASEWKATRVEIILKKPVIYSNIGYNLSKFKKASRYSHGGDIYIYYHKTLGVGFEVDYDVIREIYLFPPVTRASMLCENNVPAKKFYSSENWFAESELAKPSPCHLPGRVESLALSENQITVGTTMKISVSTVAPDPDDGNVTYIYEVSGGKVIGEGAYVVWDLSGVEPGLYTITAGIKDRCGGPGRTKTETVVVGKSPKK